MSRTGSCEREREREREREKRERERERERDGEIDYKKCKTQTHQNPRVISDRVCPRCTQCAGVFTIQ